MLVILMMPSMSFMQNILFKEEACKQFLLNQGVFYATMSCPACNNNMERSESRWSFRCGVKSCRKEVSLSKDTFFDNCRLKA